MADHIGKGCLWRRKDSIVVTPSRFFNAVGRDEMEGASDLLGSAVTTTALGAAVRIVLLFSRNERFDFTDGPKDFDQRLAERFGLKSNKGFFPGVRCVSMSYRDRRVSFTALRNRRGGTFEAFGVAWRAEKEIVVAFDAPDSMLGEAAREALNRAV